LQKSTDQAEFALADWYHVGMTSPHAPVKERPGAVELIDEFVSSAYVFSMAVCGLLEQRALRELADAQITSSQLALLHLAGQFEDQTVNDLAAFLGVSSAAANQAVDCLARRKLLQRRAGEVALTEAGRALLNDYQSARKRRLARIFRQFPAAELRKAVGVLDRLAGAIVMQSGDPEEVCLQCSIYLRSRCLLQEVVRRSCALHQRKRHRPRGSQA
jgi:DNA-binding MarR family transcriptional regulator